MMKEKQKTDSIKRPSAMIHMALWGLGSGTILALLYGAIILNGDVSAIGLVLLLPLLLVPAVILGGIPGAIIGFLDGLVLSTAVPDKQLPFTPAKMQTTRYGVYVAMSVITILVGFLPISLYGVSITFDLWLLFTPFIAGIAAAYAAHYYLFRLRLWSEGNYGMQKEKAKNVERLEDKPKHEEDDSYEGKTENRQHKTS